MILIKLLTILDEKDGIWYSGIVAYGKEYVFSQLGVESANPVSLFSKHLSLVFVNFLISDILILFFIKLYGLISTSICQHWRRLRKWIRSVFLFDQQISTSTNFPTVLFTCPIGFFLIWQAKCKQYYITRPWVILQRPISN